MLGVEFATTHLYHANGINKTSLRKSNKKVMNKRQSKSIFFHPMRTRANWTHKKIKSLIIVDNFMLCKLIPCKFKIYQEYCTKISLALSPSYYVEVLEHITT
jgi:hypothetical protein